MSEDSKPKFVTLIASIVTTAAIVISALVWGGKAIVKEETNAVRMEVKDEIGKINVKQAESNGKIDVINVKIDTLLDRKADKNASKKARE